MDPRPEVQQLLKSCFKNQEPHVYHQRPGKSGLKYPCIIYKLTDMPVKHADNLKYIQHREYQLTVIDEDPDSQLRENVAQLKWCRFTRSYVSDNLNHYNFTLIY